ncbi:pleckstrin-like protein [Pholiota molesta]|nr:pleckstrin-like protein [Pholiota molesta]
MSPSAAPPTPQEILRKLSVHSVSRSKTTQSSNNPVSGTESDSDSMLTQDTVAPSSLHGGGMSMHAGTSSSQPPLSSIAERRSDSGEDTEDEDAVEGGWKTADVRTKPRKSGEESVIKAGYLWKKGERRKTWKKRWFVLRPAHIAYYKSSAEYQLLRLLELSDVHSCTQVNLKRHDNTFGLISPVRTFYLQASTPQEVHEWVQAIEDAREALLATSTRTSASTPLPIPRPRMGDPSHSTSFIPPPISSSPNQHSYGYTVTSSDSEDATGSTQQGYQSTTSPTQAAFALSPSKVAPVQLKDPTKIILSGYLMKCGSKRRNWRKRWFVLTGEKLVYSGSHMDTKPHRQFPFNDILDALEYDLPTYAHRQPATPSIASPPQGLDNDEGTHGSAHTFKIVTTKRTLLLCAPTEDDEIKWLGAIRALIVRRTESGQVPGKPSKSPAHSPREVGGYEAAQQHHQQQQNQPQQPQYSTSPQGAGMVSGGLKAKVRRLSAAGSIGHEVKASS